MVFNRLIHFMNSGQRKYNPKTGQYEGGPEEVTTEWANVTDVGTDRSQALFNKFDQRALVIRLAAPVDQVWGYLTIDDDHQKYAQATTRRVLKGNTLIVQEAQP